MAPGHDHTAQVVAMRRHGERAVAADTFSRSRLFAGQPPFLELTGSGPVVQVIPPRRSTGGTIRAMCAQPVHTGQSNAIADASAATGTATITGTAATARIGQICWWPEWWAGDLAAQGAQRAFGTTGQLIENPIF